MAQIISTVDSESDTVKVTYVSEGVPTVTDYVTKQQYIDLVRGYSDEDRRTENLQKVNS